MCDLAAWTGPITKQAIEILGKYCHGSVNTDAAGIALHVGDTIKVIKAPGVIYNLFAKDAWTRMFQESDGKIQSGLIHARFATNGDPLINANNHPHYTDTGGVLVHRGIVNPKQTFVAKSECDSEQLLLSLESLGVHDGLINCPGLMTIFYYPSYHPNQLWMYTNVNILTVYDYDSTKIYNSVGLGKRRLPNKQWIIVDLKTQKQAPGPIVSTPTQTFWPNRSLKNPVLKSI